MPVQTTDAFFYTCMLALHHGISKTLIDGGDSTVQGSCIQYFAPALRPVKLMCFHLSDTAHTHRAGIISQPEEVSGQKSTAVTRILMFSEYVEY